MWYNQVYSSSRSYKRRDDIFRWLIDNGCDINYSVPLSEGSVQYSLADSMYFVYPESYSLFQQWTTMLKQEGYDLEIGNFAGETTLLTHAGMSGGYSGHAVLWLLKAGADPLATNSNGHNAIVCALSSIKCSGERHRSPVLRKLCYLIAGGCSITQCDFAGWTPSQHAANNSCWFEWCLALEYNGFDIQGTMKASQSQQSLFFSNLPWRFSPADHAMHKSQVSSKLKVLQEENSLAIQSYQRWKRANMAMLVYFMVNLYLVWYVPWLTVLKTSVKAMSADMCFECTSVLDLCSEGRSYIGCYITKDTYRTFQGSFSKLLLHHKDLYNLLHAFNRNLPNLWDDSEYPSSRVDLHTIAELNRAIVVIRIAKVRTLNDALHTRVCSNMDINGR